MFTFPVSILSRTSSSFMPYTVITATTDVQLAVNNGYVLNLATTTTTVNLIMPLTSGLTAGDRIEFYPYKGKAAIKNATGDTGFNYIGNAASSVPLNNEAVLIGFVYSGSALGWLPEWKYDLTYVPYTAAPSAIAYTVSQNGVFGSSPAATYANLTDGDSTTGTLTSNTGTNYVQFTFPFAVTVTGVKLQGGSLSSTGNVSPNLNSRLFQYSTDNSTWTTLFTVSGVNDTGNYFEFDFSSTTARYWRLSLTDYVSIAGVLFLP